MVDQGSVIAGYQLAEVVGSGPFGRTFRAEDASGGQVAIKLLKPTFLARVDGASAFERLQASIAVHAQLAHPYLARVRGAVREPAREAYGQVAEYLRGQPLAAIQMGAEVRQGRDPQGLANLLQCFEQLGDVLHWLHGQGMVHGNLKPGNVLLLPHQEEQHVKLLDLSWSAIGVAAVARGPQSFVSPEQYQGAVPTPASDQWALGTMLERMFTRGYHRLSLGVLPAALVHAVQRATHEAPEARFDSVEALVRQLREIRIDLLQSAGRPVHAPHASATLPGGAVPHDLAGRSQDPGDHRPETPRQAHPPLRRGAVDPRGAFAPPEPLGDRLGWAERTPRGGAHAAPVADDLGAALESAAGLVGPNALSDQVTKKSEMPPRPSTPDVSVQIPVPSEAEPAPSTPDPRRASTSGLEVYAKQGLRDSSELAPASPRFAAGTVPAEAKPEADAEEAEDEAPPLRRHAVGDVLSEGMADELLDAPGGVPADTFDGPTTGGVRLPARPRGDTVRGAPEPRTSPGFALPIEAPEAPNEGPPTPELASSAPPGPSEVPGVWPAVEARGPVEPAPSPVWAPRLAVVFVVLAALAFAGWQTGSALAGGSSVPAFVPPSLIALVGAEATSGSRGGGPGKTPTATTASVATGRVAGPQARVPSQPALGGAGAPDRNGALPGPGASAREERRGAAAGGGARDEARRGAAGGGAREKARRGAAGGGARDEARRGAAGAGARERARRGGAAGAREKARRAAAAEGDAREAPRRGPGSGAREKTRRSSDAAPASRRREAASKGRTRSASSPDEVLAAPRRADAPPPSPDLTPPVPASGDARDPIAELDARAGAALARREGSDTPGPCARGDAEACLRRGAARQAQGDADGALRAYERACRQGQGEGCVRAAAIHARREGGGARSAELYEAGCAQDIAEGCHRAAQRLEGAKARALEAKACALGRRASCAEADGEDQARKPGGGASKR